VVSSETLLGRKPNILLRIKDNDPGFSASFTYDALGRRTTKTINGLTQTYLYDGSDIIQETGANSASYTYGTGVDEPLVRKSMALKEYYLQDILGSVIALTDETGSISTSYNYSPFGKKASDGDIFDKGLKTPLDIIAGQGPKKLSDQFRGTANNLLTTFTTSVGSIYNTILGNITNPPNKSSNTKKP